MGLRLNTKIDRVAMITTLSKAEFNNNILWLQGLVKTYKGRYRIGKDGWSHRACIRFDGKKGAVHISVERYFSSRFLKYEFKPQCMSDKAFLELDLATDDFGKAGYRSCLVHGAISYLEIAADFVGRNTSEILIFRPYVNATVDGSKKVINTYYLGSRKSARTTVAYNRGSHPGATPAEKAWSNLMRVEVRLRRPKIAPVDLGALKTPFAQVHVCDFESLKAKAGDDPMAIEVLNACRMAGSPVAFSIHPKYRKPIMKLAASNHAPWWQPANLMNKWQSTVARQLGMDVLGVGQV